MKYFKFFLQFLFEISFIFITKRNQKDNKETTKR